MGLAHATVMFLYYNIRHGKLTATVRSENLGGAIAPFKKKCTTIERSVELPGSYGIGCRTAHRLRRNVLGNYTLAIPLLSFAGHEWYN